MVWLFDALVLYGITLAAPALGVACLLYYLFTLGYAIRDRPTPHKGMRQRLKALDKAQKANNRLYHQKEVDKVRQHWHNTRNERLTPWQCVALAVVLGLVAWALSFVKR